MKIKLELLHDVSQAGGFVRILNWRVKEEIKRKTAVVNNSA